MGQRDRHTRISRRARTVVRVNQIRIMQGRAKKEKKLMIEEAVCVGVDVAKRTLGVAASDSRETRQFANDDEGISQAIRYIAGLKPSGVILEATGHLEMPLAAALQVGYFSWPPSDRVDRSQ
ncbi:hypothetical protein ACFLVW_02725 [Chloroflexota bacterium]